MLSPGNSGSVQTLNPAYLPLAMLYVDNICIVLLVLILNLSLN